MVRWPFRDFIRRHDWLIKIITLFSVGSLLLVFMLLNIRVERLQAMMQYVSPVWLLYSSLSLLISFFFKALRWRLLLRPFKNSARVSNLFWIIGVGFLVNTLLPIRVGDVARAYVVGEKEGLDFAPSLSSIVVEKVLDMIGLLGMGLVAVFFMPLGSGSQGWIMQGLKVVGVVVAALLFVTALAVVREESMLTFLDRLSISIPLLARVRVLKFIKNFIGGLKPLYVNVKLLFINMALTVADWFTFCLGIFFIFAAFNFVIPIGAFVLGGVLVGLSYLLPAPPGYAGTYEVYWTLIFMAMGFTESDLLLAIGLFSHVVSVLVTAVVGYLGIIWLGLSFGKVLGVVRRGKS